MTKEADYCISVIPNSKVYMLRKALPYDAYKRALKENRPPYYSYGRGYKGLKALELRLRIGIRDGETFCIDSRIEDEDLVEIESIICSETKRMRLKEWK